MLTCHDCMLSTPAVIKNTWNPSRGFSVFALYQHDTNENDSLCLFLFFFQTMNTTKSCLASLSRDRIVLSQYKSMLLGLLLILNGFFLICYQKHGSILSRGVPCTRLTHYLRRREITLYSQLLESRQACIRNPLRPVFKCFFFLFQRGFCTSL